MLRLRTSSRVRAATRNVCVRAPVCGREAGAWCSGFRMLVEVHGHRFSVGARGAGSTFASEKSDAMGSAGAKNICQNAGKAAPARRQRRRRVGHGDHRRERGEHGRGVGRTLELRERLHEARRVGQGRRQARLEVGVLRIGGRLLQRGIDVRFQCQIEE